MHRKARSPVRADERMIAMLRARLSEDFAYARRLVRSSRPIARQRGSSCAKPVAALALRRRKQWRANLQSLRYRIQPEPARPAVSRPIPGRQARERVALFGAAAVVGGGDDRPGTTPTPPRWSGVCETSGQAQPFFSTSRPSSSAICTAFSAAPLRRLSDTHHRFRPFSMVESWRMRLMKVA